MRQEGGGALHVNAAAAAPAACGIGLRFQSEEIEFSSAQRNLKT